ncbi:hypothetical protein LQW54_006925 [Pestalotiopsis sp. IQ-011]
MTSANQNGAHQDEDFKEKGDKIGHHYSRFWSQPSAVADVEAYLRKYQHHQYSPTHERPEKWIRGSSHFQRDNLNQEEILVENEYAVILGNRSSFDTSQYPNEPGRAGMSFIHVLGLSKQQIFNGVSLTRDNCGVIDDIISLFESSWGRGDPNNPFRLKVIEHQRGTIQNHEAIAAKGHYAHLHHAARSLEPEHFNYGLHLWPEQSVGHLHIHIVARPWEMRQYSTFAHDAKTVDAREVRAFTMKNGPGYYGPAYKKALRAETEAQKAYEEVQQARYQSSHHPS